MTIQQHLHILLGAYRLREAETLFQQNKEDVDEKWFEEEFSKAKTSLPAVMLPTLQRLLDSHRIEEAENLYRKCWEKYTDIHLHEEVKESIKRAIDPQREEKQKTAKKFLKELLDSFQFEKAENYCREYNDYIDRKWYEIELENAKERFHKERQKSAPTILQEMLKQYQFTKAEIYYRENEDCIERDWFSKTERLYRKRCEIDLLLRSHQFLQADRLYIQQLNCFSINEYIAKKAEYIRTYTQKTFHLDQPLDSQQSEALADIEDNLLVTARAGSGKTKTLTCKGMLLSSCQYVRNPDSILMLAFNRKAAEEIWERINIRHKVPLKNIRTFHSLAHRIVQPKQDIKEDYEGEMAEHLKELLQNYPRLKPYLYEFFRKEMEDIDYKGLLLNENDYYNHARTCWQSLSLGGDRVKSYGEKCIADFLFEYGLTYTYEKPYLRYHNGNQIIYKPDFTIDDSCSQKTYILEHWAIPEKDIYSDKNIWKNKTEQQYAEERDKKRAYWNAEDRKDRKYYLIETDVSWLRHGREHFENKLKVLLESKGIPCSKLSKEELIEKVYKKHSNDLFKLFVSFIQKCRRYGYTPKGIKEKRDKYKTKNPKEDVFLRVAPEIFEKYENDLERTGYLDFDKLIHLAIKKIHETQGNCYIFDNKYNVNIKTKDLNYILIDEYQDFSKLFYDIINAIKAVNPQVKLFCVGDDWQAINGFAGSDLKYFYDFKDYFSETSRRNVLINYRSGKNIVETGNQLMRGLGKAGQSNPFIKDSGVVEIINIEDYHIEGRNNQEGTEQHSEDKKYIQACEIIIPTKDDGEWKFADFDTARYLKAIHQILCENIEILSQSDKTCMILTRTNRFGCFRCSERMKNKIIEVFSEEEKKQIGHNRIEEKIDVMTAHKAKGKEADIVFVLKCNERSFPMVHPDNRLFEIFGETEEKVLEEERRLFYVAITRAKQKLFLLTEEIDKSPFLDDIDVIKKSQETIF